MPAGQADSLMWVWVEVRVVQGGLHLDEVHGAELVWGRGFPMGKDSS